jgi:hypothetical protein
MKLDTQVGDFLAGFASLGLSIRILLFAMIDKDLPISVSTLLSGNTAARCTHLQKIGLQV